MKAISREEFQDAYMSPTEEQTARMQAKLDSLQADPEGRRRFLSSRPRRMAFVMAAVLLAAGIITAVATNTTRYATTWNGEVKVYEETANDAAREAWNEGIPDEILDKMAEAIEEGNFFFLSGSERAQSNLPIREYESEEQLIATLDAEGFPHPASLIPEGYRFVKGEVTLDSRSGFDPDKCVGCMFRGPYSLYIYTADPEDQYIISYDVYFTDEKDPDSTFLKYNIGVGLSESTNSTFYFYTDEEYATQTLSVPGMEEAFSIRTQEEERLHMYRSIRKDPVYLSGKLADLKFRYQTIDAHGPVDDILKVFENWQ